MPRKRKRREWRSWSIDYLEVRKRWRVRPPKSVDPKRPARTFKTRADAEAFIRAEQERLATAARAAPARDVTLEEWLGRWYATTADAADWSISTRGVYREHLWYWSRLYGVRLGDLTTTELNRVAGLLRTVGAERRPAIPGHPRPKAPRPLANRTVRAAAATLERALEAARHDGLIDRNPAAAMTHPKARATRTGIWNIRERRLVYAELERDDLYAAYLIEIEDGLRAGEVLGLKWSDVDVEHRVIHVRRIVVKARVQEWPKNRRPRDVPMGPYSLAALLRHRDRGVMTGSGPDGWVFCRPDGGPVRYHQLRHRLLRACARAGVAYRPTHVQRHIHTTELLAAGIPAADVAERLGHGDTSTLPTYSHPDPERRRQVVDAAASIVARILGASGENGVQDGVQHADSEPATRRDDG